MVQPTEALCDLTPSRVQSDRLGLSIPENFAYDEWVALGTRLSRASASAMWLLGDWLAYGQQHYQKTQWGNKVPDVLYERLSQETGYSVQTLMNAKSVCARLPRSGRPEGLTYNHAEQIVFYAPSEKWSVWINRTLEEGLTVKKLRETLRRAKAVHRSETADEGTNSFLEKTRQFVRDFQSEAPRLSPALRKEIAKILAPVVKQLG